MAVKTQQLRSSTASKRPTASALLDGELALNLDAGTPGAFFEDANGAIVKIGPAEVGGTAPNASPAAGGSSGNTTGELWFDTANAGGNAQDALKVFDGSNFVNIGQVTLGATNITLGASTTTAVQGMSLLSSGVFTALNDGEVRFAESLTNGSNYIAFKAPSFVTTNTTLILPDGDGSNGNVLQTNGSGVLAWGEGSTNDISDGDTFVSVNGNTDTIVFHTAGANRAIFGPAGGFIPAVDSTVDIGTTTLRWKDLYIDSITCGGNITGTWDGSTISAAKGGTGIDASSAANGSLLIGNGSGLTLTTLTPGTGLTITNASGSITPSITDTGVSAAAYGSASVVPTYTVNAQGQLTAAANVTIDIPHTQVNDFDAGVQANRLDQMAAPTAAVNFNGQKITGIAEPTADTDAANKGYVDSVAEGLDSKASCTAATATALPAVTYNNGVAGVGATLTANAVGAVTIDGVAADTVGERLLIKDQAAALQNGIYEVTTVGTGAAALVLTRTEDADTADQILHAFTFIEEGTTNANNGYTCTAPPPITMGTTALPFTQFSGAGQVIAGTGMTKTGNTLNVNGTANRITANSDDIDIASTYVGQTSITTLGTVATGTWNATIIGKAYGGTGVDNSTGLTASHAFMAPNGASGAASFREILTSDIAPTTGGSFDAGTY